ncbi:MAG: hypothetical protein AAF726_07505, partial [Planctomycetota bacterium]
MRHLVSLLAALSLVAPLTAQCLIDSGGPTPSVARTFYGSYIDTDGDRVVVGQGTWFGRRSATVFERGPGGWSI